MFKLKTSTAWQLPSLSQKWRNEFCNQLDVVMEMREHTKTKVG